MTDSNASAHATTRRSFTRGAAWAVPAVSIAAAAPASAASPVPAPATLAIPMYASYSGSGNTNQYTFRSVTNSGSTTTGSSYCISNTTTKSVITKPKVTLYLPLGTGVTFSNGSGGSTCWSPLAYDAAAGTRTYNGCTLYAYTATYTCAVTPSAGSTCLPAFVFTSAATAPALCTPYWYKEASVLVGGTPATASSGPNQYT